MDAVPPVPLVVGAVPTVVGAVPPVVGAVPTVVGAVPSVPHEVGAVPPVPLVVGAVPHGFLVVGPVHLVHLFQLYSAYRSCCSRDRPPWPPVTQLPLSPPCRPHCLAEPESPHLVLADVLETILPVLLSLRNLVLLLTVLEAVVLIKLNQLPFYLVQLPP